MKKETWNILGAVVAIVTLCFLITLTGCKDTPVDAPAIVELKVGQVWACEQPSSPFESRLMRTVLALKDGYVQWRFWYEGDTEPTGISMTCSSSEDHFRVGATLVEEEMLAVIEDPNELIDITTGPVSDVLPVWGNGELPDKYQEFFGTSNGARLDFVQNQAIEKHGLIIAEIARRVVAMEGTDPNEVGKR